MHPVEDMRGSGDNLDCRRVELSTNVTLARSRWTSNYYITPARGSSDQLERRCWSENHVQGEAGPPCPRLSNPRKQEGKTVIARRVWGSICCSSVQSPTHLSDTILSIKWEVYFSKELCPVVVIMSSLWFCMHLHMSMQYFYDSCLSLRVSSCRHGLKVERNKLLSISDGFYLSLNLYVYTLPLFLYISDGFQLSIYLSIYLCGSVSIYFNKYFYQYKYISIYLSICLLDSVSTFQHHSISILFVQTSVFFLPHFKSIILSYLPKAIYKSFPSFLL